MTRQACERFEYQGQELSLYGRPHIPRHPRIGEGASHLRSTDLRRGYLGSWRIENERLYLVGLEGRYRLIGPRPIFADWVSGRLLVNDPENPNGALRIKVRRGRVVSKTALRGHPRLRQLALLALLVYPMLLLLLIPPAMAIVALFAG